MRTMSRPSFDQYVAARSGVLLRFAYVLCGDRHLAEDLVQEVLIKAHRRWSSIEADDPEGYLKRALVRTHVSWVRRRSSTEIAMPSLPDAPDGGGLDDAHASRDEMWALLARLPRAQRAVLVLRYFEDLEDRRIAEVVGVSRSTVRVHAHRGLNTLRETLAERAAQAPSGAGMAERVERGVRRAAVRRRVAAVGGVAVIVAVLALLVPLLRPDGARVPVGPSTPRPSESVSHSPSPTSAPAPSRPVSIADASAGRLLQASDAPSTYGREPLSAAELAASARLPCATTDAATDAQVLDRNGMTMSFGLQPSQGFDSQAFQTLTLYRPGGAAQYMSDLGAALATCPADQGRSYAADASNFAGDESVLIRVNPAPPSDPAIPYTASWYQVVMRAGDVVMILKVTPFESGSVPRQTIDTMLDLAISRAEG